MGNCIDHVLFPLRDPVNESPNIKYDAKTGLEYLFVRRTDSEHVILFSHGNTSRLDQVEGFLKEFASQTGYSVLAYEYPKNPNTETVKQTVRAAYGFLRFTERYHPQKIVLMGYSIGTGVTLDLIRDIARPKAVVLVAPFTSIKEYVSSFRLCLCGTSALTDRFPNSQLMKRLDVPLLLIHGELDTVLPAHMSRELYARYQNPKKMYGAALEIVPYRDHNTIMHSHTLAPIFSSFCEQEEEEEEMQEVELVLMEDHQLEFDDHDFV